LQPYNATLALHQLVENSDLTFNLDNEALYNICTKRLGIPSPGYRDLNGIIAQTLAGVSTTLRFPGQLNSDFRKLAVNLVPFPRLHFLTVGYAPLTRPGSRDYVKTGIPELTSELFNPECFLAACNPMHGKYLTCCE
jgi:tubulin beta